MEDVTQVVRDGIAGIERKFSTYEARLADLEQKRAGGWAPGEFKAGHHPAADVFKSPAFQMLLKREVKGATVPLSIGMDRLLTKSALIADSNSSDGPGYSVHPTRLPGLFGEPRRALTLLDALPKLPVGSGSFTFNRLDSYTRAADYQSEQGTLKPEQTIASTLVTVPIATIAVWNQASEQVLADEPALQQQIGTMLQYGVRRKLETEIVAGAGGAGEIAGLTDSSNYTAFTPSTSSATHADVLGEAQAALDVAGWSANLIVLHPEDWHRVRSLRASGSDEYLAGSFAAPAAPSVWSIPVVTCPALTEGTFLIMDTSQVLVLDRMQSTIDIGYHDSGFVKNLLTIRAELRAGLAVLDPAAVMYGDLY